MKKKDLFDAFVDGYEEGRWGEALELVLPYPDIRYDTLISKEPLFQRIIDFVDASVYKGTIAFQQTQKVLETLISDSGHFSILLQGFLEAIQKEALMENYFLHEDIKQENLIHFPERYRHLFNKKLIVSQGIEILKKNHPEFCRLLDVETWKYKIPWLPYAYPQSPLEISVTKEGMPLLFLEAIEKLDYHAYLKPFQGMKCILAVETLAHLFQLLQFPAIHHLLEEANVALYLLEFPPDEQFNAQGFNFVNHQKIQPYLMLDRKCWKKALPAFKQAFQDFMVDPTVGSQLYHVVKRALFNTEAYRYGKSRFVALSIERGFQSWFKDSSMKRLSIEVDLGPEPIDGLKELIEDHQLIRRKRSFSHTSQIRLAHIVPQIVDGNHAPTRLLRTLCKNGDSSQFEIFVVSTERLVDHPYSYPVTTYSSESSLERGASTIKKFEEKGIKVLVDESSLSYEGSVEHARKLLEKLKIDVAVFHGPDEVNQLISSSCDVPARLFFDHGSLPTHHCFDLLILSTQEAYQQNHDRFLQMGMKSCYLPFSTDSREDWLDKPFARKDVGLPEKAFIMTTISNHLTSRLSQEMCEAIGEILVKCPQAFYAPIGTMNEPDKFRKIFEKYRVNERVKFMGFVANPNQLVRSMNLYLNEFPFGSGLTILDAMAAGCPVVSMYDEQGPQQSRYAATYFGIDHVIKSGKREDYIHLACSLILDPHQYEEWSKYAFKQYEKRVDIKSYVLNFEKIIRQLMDTQD